MWKWITKASYDAFMVLQSRQHSRSTTSSYWEYKCKRRLEEASLISRRTEIDSKLCRYHRVVRLSLLKITSTVLKIIRGTFCLPKSRFILLSQKGREQLVNFGKFNFNCYRRHSVMVPLKTQNSFTSFKNPP